MPTHAHAHGALAWAELCTTDLAAATRFYGAIFGWRFVSSAGGGGTLLRGERPFADVVALPPELRARGVPPHWEGFVAVDDVDAGARRAQALGGTLLQPPAEVGARGRVATVRDPGGAHLVLWRPREPASAAPAGDPAAFAWFGLLAREPAAAVAFYGELLGWRARAAAPGSIADAMILARDDVDVASVVPMRGRPAAVPSHWIVYFAVDACDVVVERALGLGGALVVGPTALPGLGRFAALDDPQGGGFAIVERAASA